MNWPKRFLLLTAIALGFLGTELAPSGTASNASLKIGGSGSPVGSMKMVVTAFQKQNPGIPVEAFPHIGSAGGIKALVEGAIDIALSSRDLRENERKPGMVSIFYARTPFVFATQRRTPASGVTLEQIAQIYEGTLTKWRDGSPIRLVLRPETDTDSDILRKFSPAIERALRTAHSRRGMFIAVNDIDSIDAIERIPGSLGTTTLTLIIAEGRAVKPLAVERIIPTLHGVADGSYPYWKPFYMILGAQPSEAARRFAAFVRSPLGAKLLTQSGHLVVEGER